MVRGAAAQCGAAPLRLAPRRGDRIRGHGPPAVAPNLSEPIRKLLPLRPNCEALVPEPDSADGLSSPCRPDGPPRAQDDPGVGAPLGGASPLAVAPQRGNRAAARAVTGGDSERQVLPN